MQWFTNTTSLHASHAALSHSLHMYRSVEIKLSHSCTYQGSINIQKIQV